MSVWMFLIGAVLERWLGGRLGRFGDSVNGNVVGLGVVWRVAPRQLLVEGGARLGYAGSRCSASSCTLVGEDGRLRSWRQVPRWLVQAWM